MADLFSDEWMKTFMTEWNNEPALAGALQKIGFNSENGVVTAAGSYNGEELSWDIRAKRASWEKWIKKGIGMAGLGMAYTTGKMKFVVGDYLAMVKDPRMAGPFIKSFGVMGNV